MTDQRDYRPHPLRYADLPQLFDDLPWVVAERQQHRRMRRGVAAGLVVTLAFYAAAWLVAWDINYR